MKTYDLSGIWSVWLDEEKKGQKETVVYSDQMQLPGTTDLAQKGRKNEAIELGYLTREYIFEGYAWYQRTVTIDQKQIGHPMRLYLERTRKTKVWIDDSYVGAADSMVVPHCYDITGCVKQNTFTITILVDNTDYKTKGGHMTSPDTQTNWNGIIGKMELRMYEDIYVDQMDVFTDLQAGTITAVVSIVNITGNAVPRELSARILDMEGKPIYRQMQEVEIPAGQSQTKVIMKLPENVKLWSEYEPNLYTFALGLNQGKEEAQVTFGVREFKPAEDKFQINGQTTFLRGKSESLIYPLSGCTPMTLKEWLEIMSTVKSYGINHYRCHTCCLPEAAFEAADQLGIYVQPEISFWGTITEPGEEGYCKEEQEYLYQEGMRILEAYGNHPSFVMMTLGNELWGSEKRMNEMLKAYREKDDRHLYAQGCNNFMWVPKVLEEDDFFVGVRMGAGKLIRGSFAMCDAPQGFIQTMEPNMSQNYDEILRPDRQNASFEKEESQEKKEYQIQYGTGVKTVEGNEKQKQLISHVPVINHEVGQYTTYPNYKEIEKYTGVLKPRNLMEFQKRLADQGMLELDEQFFLASGKLTGTLYKMELEAALRSRYLAGFQLLDLQDYSGQGTALVGILDSLLEEKGTVGKEEWTSFCNDIVLLAEFDRFILENGSRNQVKVQVADYSNKDLKGQQIQWRLVELCQEQEDFEYGKNSKLLMNKKKTVTQYRSYTHANKVIQEGSLPITDKEHGLVDVGSLEFAIPEGENPCKYKLVLTLPEEGVHNQYEFWSYPKVKPDIQSVEQWFHQLEQSNVVITSERKLLKDALGAGQRVLYLPNGDIPAIHGEYATDFWNYPMFRSISEGMNKPVPIGTMGLLIENEHPVFREFPAEIYTTPQWYPMICHSEFLILDEDQSGIKPIVSMIDNFERNHRLAMMLELEVGKGKLFLCTIHFDEIIHTMEAQSLLNSMRLYLDSPQFEPKHKISTEDLEKILTRK